MMNDDNSINKFFKGELSGDELKSFDAKVQQDPAFAKKVAFEADLRAALKEAHTSNFERKADSSKYWLLLAFVILILAIIFGISKLNETSPPPPKVEQKIDSIANTFNITNNPTLTPLKKDSIKKTLKISPTPPKTPKKPRPIASLLISSDLNINSFPKRDIRRGSESETSDKKLTELLNTNQFQTIIDQLSGTELSTENELLLGFAYLKNDKPQQALLHLKKVLESQYHESVRWYLAIAYLQLNNKQNTKLFLKQIVDWEGGGHFNEERARAVLEKLE